VNASYSSWYEGTGDEITKHFKYSTMSNAGEEDEIAPV
jgi:hypothetical protein